MNWVTAAARAAASASIILALAACGGSDEPDPSAPPPAAMATIGTAGGTIAGPSGEQVVVPAGALAQPLTILIAADLPGAPDLPAGVKRLGRTFAITPHGTTFALPVAVTLPFDPALLSANGQPALYKTNAAMTAFEPVAGASVAGLGMTGAVSGFSYFVVVEEPAPVVRDDPVRTWEFKTFFRNGSVWRPLTRRQEGGVVHDVVDHGKFPFVDLDGDGVSTSQVFSSANGKTYWVSAEAPTEEGAYSNIVELNQYQGFRKMAPDARLEYVVTDLQVHMADLDREPPTPDQCLWNLSPCRGVMFAQLYLAVVARAADRHIIHAAEAYIDVDGWNGNWGLYAESEWDNGTLLWEDEDVEFNPDAGGDGSGSRATLKLKKPLVRSVDLSGIPVGGEFQLSIEVNARVFNSRGRPDGREAGISVYLRDPAHESGAVLNHSGLVPTNNAVPETDKPDFVAPECEGPPDPAAGVLQFSAPQYRVPELPTHGDRIRITRTQGSRGAVSATFSTRDGSAVAGQHYEPRTFSVYFADGDTRPRTVQFEALDNGVAEADRTVQLELSQPRGCATLGAVAAAIVAIADDDRAALPPPRFNVGGSVTGLQGSGLVLRDHLFQTVSPGNGAFTFPVPTATGSAYAVEIERQPVDPIQMCTVARGSGTVTGADVTDILVECAPPQPQPGLDHTFGTGGLAVTPGAVAPIALAVQGDGRIVTLGSGFTLSRHHPDGSLDTSFGMQGTAPAAFEAGITGTAADVAIQDDGRIVVAGTITSAAIPGLANFGVRRYNADGSVDTSFGDAGLVTTDFSGQADEARAVVVQRDGRILVGGRARNATTDFGLVRYNGDGSLDDTFGRGGKLSTDVVGGTDFLSAIALQDDGRIVVLGRVSLAGSVFVELATLVRHHADGSLDRDFGDNGMRVDAEAGHPGTALALQRDGRILVGAVASPGTSGAVFALRRHLVDGRIDTDFGTGGTVTTAFTTGGNGSNGRAVAVRADGRIVVVGGAQSGGLGTSDLAVAIYDAGGALDAEFDGDGKLQRDLFGHDDVAVDVALQADGRIVVAGTARNGFTPQSVLMRLLR